MRAYGGACSGKVSALLNRAHLAAQWSMPMGPEFVRSYRTILEIFLGLRIPRRRRSCDWWKIWRFCSHFSVRGSAPPQNRSVFLAPMIKKRMSRAQEDCLFCCHSFHDFIEGFGRGIDFVANVESRPEHVSRTLVLFCALLGRESRKTTEIFADIHMLQLQRDRGSLLNKGAVLG